MKKQTNEKPDFSQNKKSIAILGCGWLGFPLAKKLIEEGFSVKGTTTSTEKFAAFNSEGITPFLIELTEEEVLGNTQDFLKSTETLIIDVPPGLRKNPETNFVQKIKTLLPEVEGSEVKNVLFISSTSVFADAKNFPTITENSPLNGSSENAKQLIASEQLLFENRHFKTTVLRFGGLIGSDRHPVYYLSGRTGVKNPEAPVNLIHRKDCIEIILQILKQGYWEKQLNAVYPKHPTKKEYYTKTAEKNSLEIPHFEEKDLSKGKIINSKKVEEELVFRFRHSI